MDNNVIHNLIKVCKQCGKDYKVRSPSELETRVFCSKECRINSTQKKSVSLCEVCKKEIYVLPCRKNNKYCSLECKHIGHRKINDPTLRQCNKCLRILTIDMFCKSNFNSRVYRCHECEKKRSAEITRTPNGRFVFSKSLAKRRGLEWTIDKVSYFNLLKQKCHYCGIKLNETGIGLDRKDNGVGYLYNNVVPCCGLCNTTKSDNFTYDEMLILAQTIKLILESRYGVLVPQLTPLA